MPFGKGFGKAAAAEEARLRRKYAPKKKVPKAVKQYVKRQAIAASDVRQAFRQSGSYAAGGDAMSYTISYINVCSFPAQDDSIDGREGDTITPISLRFWGHMIASDTYNICRFVLFQFMGDLNYTAPQAAIMFNTQVVCSGNAPAPYAPLRREAKSTYHILYDSGPKVLSLASASYLNENGVRLFDVMIPRKKLRKIKSTVTDSNNGTGFIYAALISDSSAIVHPQIQWISDLRYIS